MPPARSSLSRPGLDATTGKFWCDCTVQGCRTETRHLNKVERRTFYAHQQQQKIAALRAQNATAFDLQSVRASQGASEPALSAEFGGSSGTSGIENDDNSYLPDIEDALGLTPFHSIISSSGSSSNASDDGEVEVDSEFGDGVEREEMVDSERPVFDCGEDEMAQEDLSRKIMILVVSLASFFGLGERGANMLFAFYASEMQPRLLEPGPPIPRQIRTVRQHLGLDPPLVR
ncbi:hypothetical protein CF335_g8821, partial [Tilletia laevis]